MDIPSFSPRFGGHLVAIISGTAFFTIIPSALYVGLIIWSNDLGGPMNLVLIPVLSGAAGFAVSVVIFMPVSVLAEKTNLRSWLRVVGVSFGALALAVVSAWVFVGTTKPQNRVYLIAGTVAIFVVGGFFVYLCSLALYVRAKTSRSFSVN